MSLQASANNALADPSPSLTTTNPRARAGPVLIVKPAPLDASSVFRNPPASSSSSSSGPQDAPAQPQPPPSTNQKHTYKPDADVPASSDSQHDAEHGDQDLDPADNHGEASSGPRETVTIYIHPDDSRDKVLAGIIKVLMRTGNVPATPRELSGLILKGNVALLG